MGVSKSQQLHETRAQEDNDLRALGIGKQIIREERQERFEEKWLGKFKHLFEDNIRYDDKLFAYVIEHGSDKLAYYPKANKVFDYKKNIWIEKGLKFLIKKYLNEKTH